MQPLTTYEKGKRMTQRALLLSCFLVLILVCQCAAVGRKVEVRPVWESGDAYIRLFREIGSARGYDQPAEFSEEEMRQVLGSLFFSRHEYVHWSAATRVFSEDDIRILARFFQQAFLEAGPDDVVEFYLPDRSRKLLGISSQNLLTRGRCFVEGGAIHFRFDNIQEEVKAADERPEEESSRARVAWKLDPQQGQQYEMDKGITGEYPNPGWIRLELGGLGGQPGLVQTPPSPKPPGPPQSLAPGAPPEKPAVKTQTGAETTGKTVPRARLRELKQMLDEGLITPQDYERKKKDILDSL